MDYLMLLLLIFVVSYIVLGLINITIIDNMLWDGRMQAHFRIIRNGDGTISLQRKEILGIWFDIGTKKHRDTMFACDRPLEENTDNLKIANDTLDEYISTIEENGLDKLNKLKRINLQKNSVKIIRKHP